jgi:transcriptional regulator with XRE-family HTH domain
MVQSIGQLLRARREELGLSRREVAKRAGTTHSVVARVEAGSHRMAFDALLRVTRVLGGELIIRLVDLDER